MVITRSIRIFNTILKNAFSNYVGLFGAIAIAFLLSPFLVNTLGDTKYGIWSIVAALTGYMSLLDLGVSSAVAKYVAKHKALNDYKSINVVISSAIAIMVTVAACLIFASPLIANLVVNTFKITPDLKDTVHTLVIISSVDVATIVASGIFFGAFYGFQRNEITNAAILFASLVKAVAFYFALTSGYSLLAMGALSLVANFLAALLLAFLMRKTEPRVELTVKHADKSTILSIFHYSKFTFLTMLGMQLIYYSDVFVIGFFLNAAAITIYSIPWSLGEYSNKLMSAVAQTFVPVFSEQEATKDKALYSTYVTGTKAILIISNLLCIGILTLGDYFIGIWMGPKYAIECSVILSIIFLTQLFKSPQLLSYSILLGTASHQKFSAYNMVFSIANLILSILMIKKFGLIGVAAATAFTQIIFYGLITPILTSKVIGFSLPDYFKETYLRMVPASLLLYAMLTYVAKLHPPTGYLSLLGSAMIAAIIYIIAVFFTTLDNTERQFATEGAAKLLGKIYKPKF